MTDNEIIKALEACNKNYYCGNCPNYPEVCKANSTEMINFALDLINRQKAEIERLEEDNFIKSQKRANIFEIINAFERGRTAGIKRFAERLKEEMRKYCGEITVDDINNLVKEMIGEA